MNYTLFSTIKLYLRFTQKINRNHGNGIRTGFGHYIRFASEWGYVSLRSFMRLQVTFHIRVTFHVEDIREHKHYFSTQLTQIFEVRYYLN